MAWRFDATLACECVSEAIAERNQAPKEGADRWRMRIAEDASSVLSHLGAEGCSDLWATDEAISDQLPLVELLIRATHAAVDAFSWWRVQRLRHSTRAG